MKQLKGPGRILGVVQCRQTIAAEVRGVTVQWSTRSLRYSLRVR